MKLSRTYSLRSPLNDSSYPTTQSLSRAQSAGLLRRLRGETLRSNSGSGRSSSGSWGDLADGYHCEGTNEATALEAVCSDDQRLLVRRAERRIGKKSIVLKAKLQELSCRTGEAIRIKREYTLSRYLTASLSASDVWSRSHWVTFIWERVVSSPVRVKNHTPKVVALVKVYLCGI